MISKLVESLPKVFIGFIAAGSAAVVPRLVAQLTLKEGGNVTLFSTEFIVVACVFALFVGVIVAIMEYGAKRPPRDTFMTALGIPALLAGALTTTDGADKIAEQQGRIQALSEQVSELAGIPREENALEFLPADGHGALSPRGDSIGALLGLGVAQAATGATQQTAAQGLGYAVREPFYVVVLARTTSAQEANARAAALQRSQVDARVMRAGDAFYVTAGTAMPQGAAVREAMRIKGRQLPGVSVSLVRAAR